MNGVKKNVALKSYLLRLYPNDISSVLNELQFVKIDRTTVDNFFVTWRSRGGRFTMSLKLNWWFCAVISYVIVLVNSQNVHKRFEYKYSFKPPYLAQKDGSVPFWEYGGSKY